MTRRGKLTFALSAIAVIFVTYLVGTFWWADRPPRRPTSVSPMAVYWPGLALGLPGPRHGAWVACWFDRQQSSDQCRIDTVDGRALFEGTYSPYLSRVPIRSDELLIDLAAMSKAQEQVEVATSAGESSSPGPQMVPLIYLRNGDVLIPQKSYDTGRRRLDDLRQAGSPYAPR
jgi:hypothetical protein